MLRALEARFSYNVIIILSLHDMCSTLNWNVFLGIFLSTIGPLKVALLLSMKVNMELLYANATTSLTLQ